MGRTRIRYAHPQDAASSASVGGFQQVSPASQYATARFQEWQQNAAARQQALELKQQILQSQAETAGLEQRRQLYNEGEIRRQVNMYNYGMPRLREALKAQGVHQGSPEYSKEILDFALSIPDAFTHVPAIQQDLHDLSKTDKTAAELANAIKTFKQGYQDATGQAPTKVHVG